MTNGPKTRSLGKDVHPANADRNRAWFAVINGVPTRSEPPPESNRMRVHLKQDNAMQLGAIIDKLDTGQFKTTKELVAHIEEEHGLTVTERNVQAAMETFHKVLMDQKLPNGRGNNSRPLAKFMISIAEHLKLEVPDEIRRIAGERT